MKYADNIKLLDIQPVCDMLAEKDNYWKTFVPNPSFSEIAEYVINALLSQNKGERKSFWIQGSYGCGKSHAAIVMRHLLSDEYDEIKEIATGLLPSGNIVAKYNKLRSNNKYFTVALKGSMGILNERHAAAVIRHEVKTAMQTAGIRCNLKTEGDVCIELVNNLEKVSKEFLFYEGSPLNRYAKDNVKKVISHLEKNDTEFIDAVEEALTAKKIIIDVDDIVEWLREAEKELKKGGYAGLIIFWDELTSLRQQLKEKPEIWNMFQNIAELGQGEDCCTYLYLISHSTEWFARGKSGRNEEENHIRDRFYTVHYEMEPVTAYAIMEHLIDTDHPILDTPDDEAFTTLLDTINGDNTSQDAILKKETLRRLLPLHPATAYLCSFIAKNVRSSTRSILEFVTGKERGYASFLQKYGTPELCTPDFLWMYCLPWLKEEVSKCADILANYEKYKNIFDTRESRKVYYGLLLLNAVSRLSGETCALKPRQEHLLRLFAGCGMRGVIDGTLTKINQNKIIKKDVAGFYYIKYIDLDPRLLEEEKKKLRERLTCGKRLLEYAGYDEKWIENSKDSNLAYLPRIKSIRLGDVTSAPAEHSMKKEFSSLVGNYELNLFFYFGITKDEVENTAAKWNEWVEKGEISIKGKNLVAIISIQPLGEDRFSEYIEYQATANLYRELQRLKDSEWNREQANQILEAWLKNALRTCYLGWEGMLVRSYSEGIGETINKEFCRENFRYGAEYFREGLPSTDQYWKVQGADKIIRTVAEAQDLNDLRRLIPAANVRLECILQSRGKQFIFNGTTLAKFENAPIDHPLVAIKTFIDEQFNKHLGKGFFSVSRVLEPLSRPPYGLYKNKISLFILAICLKPYMHKLYSKSGVIGTASDFSKLILQITCEWMHERSGSDAMQVRFRSQEEQDFRGWLAKIFVDVPENPDTMTYMRDILHTYTERMEAPLWVLCYGKDDTKINFANAWDTILEIFENTKDTRSQSEYKKVNNVFKEYQYEFEKTLTKENFISRYDEFIMEYLERGDAKFIPEIKEYVRSQLQQDMDTWGVGDVERKIQEWKRAREKEKQDFYKEEQEFCGWLEKIFKAPKNSDTTTYMRGVLRTYTERMGAPLWVLRYGEDDTNFANDWNTVMEFLSNTREMPTSAEYQKMNAIFGRHQNRLVNLVEGDFIAGYDKFIMNCLDRHDQEIVRQLPKIKEHVRSQLPPDMDTWRIEDVKQAVGTWVPPLPDDLIDRVKKHVLTTDRYIEMISMIIKEPNNVQKVIREFYEEPNYPSHEGT